MHSQSQLQLKHHSLHKNASPGHRLGQSKLCTGTEKRGNTSPFFCVICSQINLMRNRNWVFTLNNYTDTECQNLSNEDLLSSQKVKTMIWTKEKVSTHHLQGILQMKNPTDLHSVKVNIPALERSHLEPMKGKLYQAALYCLKDYLAQMNKSFEDWKIISQALELKTGQIYSLLLDFCKTTDISQITSDAIYIYTCDPSLTAGSIDNLLNMPKGKTNNKDRLLAIFASIKDEKKSEIEIAEMEPDLWCKYHCAFNKYRLLVTPPRRLPTAPDIIVLCGSTGTGKSHWASEQFPEAYWKEKNVWWDGYTDQKSVIIDEFYGWLAFDLILRICDKYPLKVEIKGGMTQFLANTIVFTSNKDPREWWKQCYFGAFERRVTKWILKTSQSSIETFTDYNSFNQRFPCWIY